MSCQKQFFFLSALILASAGFSPSVVYAQAPDFDGHLAAGEFGLAAQIAENAGPEKRDALLARVAAAQRNFGAPGASFSTLRSIQDDRTRLGAVDAFRNGPARGGAAQADFDSLIELITSTIAPQSWDEVGGAGAIDGFDGGVYVDSAGVMRRMKFAPATNRLLTARSQSQQTQQNNDARRESRLRKVSLNRLERELQLLELQGKAPTETMRNLAGLQQIQYVFVYPDTGDVVIAGPASDWIADQEGRQVGVKSGKPVLQLDDFVVLLRNAYEEKGRFGCSITPTQAGLARTQKFLAESSQKAIRPSQRDEWLDNFRATLGKQDIVVYGVDPKTRVGKVLVEADYRMKLVGMGLEEGTLGVVSYLDSVTPGPDGSLPDMNVLRWWFTLNYKAIQASKSRDAYALQGQGVKVLSENEMLTERGERKHTGKSSVLNLQFANSFTKHFPALAAKYPVYAELRNIFDLALVAALIRAEDIPNRVNWHPSHLLDKQRYRPAVGVAPTRVESIVNYRVIDKKHFIAGVSGGVTVDTSQLVNRGAIAESDYGLLKAERQAGTQVKLSDDAWWWD
ncbi:MAG TPA: hypothetical protein DCY79_15040 [Planctomycetaceae bacterium]|nr:hypothetical protein [Blastopirellula sp.]HAY81119.1 hypothetical protein [Planctomycetaceae bacterium]